MFSKSKLSLFVLAIGSGVVASAHTTVNDSNNDAELIKRSPLGPMLGTSMNDNGPAGKDRLGSSITNIVTGATTGNFPGMAGAISNTVADGKAGKAADQQAQMKQVRSQSSPSNMGMRKVMRREYVNEEGDERDEDDLADDGVTNERRSVGMKDFSKRIYVRTFKAAHNKDGVTLEKRGLGKVALAKGLVGGKKGMLGAKKGAMMPVGGMGVGVVKPVAMVGAAPC